MNSSAKYIHDCDKCIFLGQYKHSIEPEVIVDLWCKSSTPILDSVIARYGNDGE